MNTTLRTAAIICTLILFTASCKNNTMTNEPDTSAKIVALTFDDGPNTVTTPQVIEMLKKYNVVASFFVIGQNINAESAAVMKSAFDMGCEIANHSRTHSSMPTLTADSIRAEIAYTSQKVQEVIGIPTAFFRPPYIALNQTMFDTIDLPFICGIGCTDWEEEVSSKQRATIIINDVSDGSIILLHDFAGNDKTVAALDSIIPTLKAQGYEFVTVSQLFKRKNITPKRNVIYSNVLDESEWNDQK